MTVITAAPCARRGEGGRMPGLWLEELFVLCLFAAGLGDCRFMAASVPGGGGGHITHRR